MDKLGCEVVGCDRPAVWKREGPFNAMSEDYLCDRCLEQLRRMFPKKATRYVPCNAAPLCPLAKMDTGDEVIVIQ